MPKEVSTNPLDEFEGYQSDSFNEKRLHTKIRIEDTEEVINTNMSGFFSDEHQNSSEFSKYKITRYKKFVKRLKNKVYNGPKYILDTRNNSKTEMVPLIQPRPQTQ